jgi:4-amino-4-deoxy-L-arabinose transferase-like glycosyltransferase
LSRRAIALVAAAAAVAAALWLVRDHTQGDSLSADEPIHILAGYLEVAAHTAIVNIEHPPLAKALAGWSVARLPVPPPPDPIPMGMQFSDFGHGFLFGSPVSPDRIAAAARAPFLALLALLLAVVFFAARRRWGNAAALFAVCLLAFDPNLIAHAGIVHTDVPAALLFVSSVLAWDASQRRPTPLRLAGAAVVLGIALATKFSTVYLLPIFAIQGLLAANRDASPGRAVVLLAARLAGVTAAALVVVAAIYWPFIARMRAAEQVQLIHEMVAGRGAPRLSGAIEALVPVSRPLAHYFGGLAAVARQNVEGGGVNYLLGRVRVSGFPSYFVFAYFFKSTLAFLLATGVVLSGLWRERRTREEAALLLIPVLVLFLVAAGASYNIGIRHLLPVYPFVTLAAAGILSRMRAGRSRTAATLMLVGLPLFSLAETVRVHPHELSYFNALAGGPVGGRRILSDSNVDWGLDLARLGAELKRRGETRPTVCYFGGDDVFYRIGVPDFAADPAVRGHLVAISAFHETLGPAFYAYHGAPLIAQELDNLRRALAGRARLVGRIGYSIDLYELPPAEGAR